MRCAKPSELRKPSALLSLLCRLGRPTYGRDSTRPTGSGRCVRLTDLRLALLLLGLEARVPLDLAGRAGAGDLQRALGRGAVMRELALQVNLQRDVDAAHGLLAVERAVLDLDRLRRAAG